MVLSYVLLVAEYQKKTPEAWGVGRDRGTSVSLVNYEPGNAKPIALLG